MSTEAADLRSYAAVGDGRTVAMIAPTGDVDWLPLPDLDGLPLFAALLDRNDGGGFSLAPEAPYEVQRGYLPGTNVLRTVYTTAAGAVAVTDSLNSGIAGRLPWTEFARLVEGLQGTVAVHWCVRPGTALGTASTSAFDTPAGPAFQLGQVRVAVLGVDHQTRRVGDSVLGTVVATAGSRQLVALVATEDEPLMLPAVADIECRVDRTIESWQSWSDSWTYDGAWPDAVRRSALALKLLIYSPTGAIAAAATTSLPESMAGNKNWDYRFTWIRDTAYTISALIQLGLSEEVHAAVVWLLKNLRADGSPPQMFKTLNGGDPAGRITTVAAGWRNVGPVVIGNDAADQSQLGVFGDLFSLVRSYVEAGNVLDDGAVELLSGMADRCATIWRREDSGIWELPERQHYTGSKMGCWQALESAIWLADHGQLRGDTARWRAEMEQIRQFVDTRCWSADRQAYTWYADTDLLDASVLLCTRFDSGLRMSSTIDAVRAELGAGPLLYRYSGMSDEEGTFVACAFWAVSALTAVGRHAEATALLRDLMQVPNEFGLMSEMVEAGSGQFLGNMPQALSHLALIHAALSCTP